TISSRGFGLSVTTRRAMTAPSAIEPPDLVEGIVELDDDLPLVQGATHPVHETTHIRQPRCKCIAIDEGIDQRDILDDQRLSVRVEPGALRRRHPRRPAADL